MKTIYILVKERYNTDEPNDILHLNSNFVLDVDEDFNKLTKVRKKLIANVLKSGDPWFDNFKEKYDITKLKLNDDNEDYHVVTLQENESIGLIYSIRFFKRQTKD